MEKIRRIVTAYYEKGNQEADMGGYPFQQDYYIVWCLGTITILIIRLWGRTLSFLSQWIKIITNIQNNFFKIKHVEHKNIPFLKKKKKSA